MEPIDLISEIKERLEELSEERDFLRFRIETKDKEIDGLLRRLETGDEAFEALKLQIETKDNQIDGLASNLRLKEEAFETFKRNASSEKDELEKKIEELTSENNELSEMYHNLYDTLEGSDDPDVG